MRCSYSQVSHSYSMAFSLRTQRTFPHPGSRVDADSLHPDDFRHCQGKRTGGMQTSAHSTSQHRRVSFPGEA